MFSASPKESRRTLRVELGVVAAVVTIAALKMAASILVPVVMAAFVAILGLPVLNLLAKWRVPRGVAIALVVVLDIAVLALVGWIAVESASSLREAIPEYAVRFDQLKASGLEFLNARGVQVEDASAADLLRPERVLGLAAGMAGKLSGAVSKAFLVLLLTVFILIEISHLPAKVRLAVGRPDIDLQRFTRIALDVQRYLGVKAVISLLTGLVVGIGTALAGVDFPLLWGLTAFLLNFIPNVGSVIAAIPAVLVALLQGGVGMALVVGAIYLGTNTLLGSIIEPTLVGQQMGLSILAILLSLLFWGWLWGTAGMFLSVPLTLALKSALEMSPAYSWVSVLLGPAPAVPREAVGEGETEVAVA
jgi:predicted PurR-regulated permease PerM